ncbi:MAG: radical SAM protein [Deltaproteobacteria bacterium]|nr:radical SAM protein [Deltaproteobacteria bacterium]
MAYVFGPVPSRRLGLSLGVDLIPLKTCTYNCLYCQVGRTTRQSLNIESFFPVTEVLEELGRKLEICSPDAITFSGSGEPTLSSDIDRVISFVKERTDTKTVILTNGSLLWKEDVRRRISGADIIMPTLTTAFDETFQLIHEPHTDLDLSTIFEGLKSLRRSYRGNLFLEVVLLAGFNDSEKELDGLRRMIGQISPDKIQLNTVVRPPSDPRAIPLDIKRLEDIKSLFGEKAEIIAQTPLRNGRWEDETAYATILEMAKRRPVRARDVANACGISLEEAESLIKGLFVKGALRQQEHEGEVYYME